MAKLFSQRPSRIAAPGGQGEPDRVPEDLAGGTPASLRAGLEAVLGPGQVLGRVSDLVRYASDASPYRLIPQVVVAPRTTDDVAAVLRYCATHRRHATFRAAGTSLSGQSQGDDVLIDVREYWGGMEVLDDGARLRVRPGTILAHANAVLARHGRRLGPDPASQTAATLGGVLANNAAGMRCTPDHSAYRTLREITFVLASGTCIDTADPDAEATFARAEPDLARGLLAIREQILADPQATDLITRKYSIRNTSGYSMRAFLDADTPLGIFKRLLVGSEGTLAFIAEAVLDTVEIPAVSGLWWVHLPSIQDAVAQVGAIKAMGAQAVEMLQASMLINAATRMSDPPAGWPDLPPDSAALLVEFGAGSASELEAIHQRLLATLAGAPLLATPELSTDPDFIALSWKVRSELASDLARRRPPGAVVVNEDVCFPLESLADGVRDLSALLGSYGYPTGVVGHAAYGNMHFTLTPALGQESARAGYGRFMADLVDLVIDRYHGSLKAEHGTGLNMAPFVEREWGPMITGLMWRLRRLADPNQVLGRDVLLTEDAGVHLRRFRSEPRTDPLIDACIECGFCEPVCPSRHVTTTPRQRIALRREMARQGVGTAVGAALLEQYQYDAIETCAVDASCSTACPYDIDTGALMKQFRGRQSTPARERVALAVARRWGTVEALARGVIGVSDRVQSAVGTRPLRALTSAVRTVVSADLMPTVPGPMPAAAPGTLPATRADTARAVYFPACVNRIFGLDPDAGPGPSLAGALVAVSDRAGRPVWIPGDTDGLCCGTIWSSKGYQRGRDHMYRRVAEAILGWTRGGDLPLVVDASSCSHGLIHEVAGHLDPELASRYTRVRIIDSVQWCADLLPALTVSRPLGLVVLHPGCSVSRLGLDRTFRTLAGAIAGQVLVPVGAGCCGTAGDRGLLHPELVVSATRDELADLPEDADAWLSSNRTCEMGLRHATGRPYESVVLALERATR